MPKTKKPKFDQAIALWLLKIREEKGISQEALGVQLGKGQSDIAKIEKASKRVTVLDLLNWMAALDIEYDRLDEALKPIFKSLVNKSESWNKLNER